MTTLVVIQARMGSTRLPGKVLADLGGRPMLRFMLDRLVDLPVDHLVVATSTLSGDDLVAAVASAAGVPVIRGSETDVLARYLQALDEYPAAHIVRLTADCPLADPEIVRGIINLHESSKSDYTCNVLPRTFPKGLDVEVVRAEALRQAGAAAALPVEREHVTPYLYRHPERFRLTNYQNVELLGRERWTVDTAEDLDFVRSVVKQLGPTGDFGWRDALEAAGRRALPTPGQLVLRPAVHSDRDFLQGLRNDPVSVQFSGTGRLVGNEEHDRWLASKLSDPATRLWIAHRDEHSLGMVRIDVEAALGEVSIAIAATERGRGLTNTILQLLLEELHDDVQVDGLIAAIHPANVRSLKAFRSAGFEDHGVRGDQLLLRCVVRANR